MNERDKEIYKNRYNQRLVVFGYDPKTLGWGGGKERQDLRFKALSEVGIKPQDSVLDFGCGFADLYGFLKNQGHTGDYYGIDINPDLLKVARSAFPKVEVGVLDIQRDEIHRSFDWVLASGVFNAKLHFEDNLQHIKKTIGKLYQLSNLGIAVDFMSKYVDFQHPDAFHLDPGEMIVFGKELGAKIVIRMDYLPYEFCVYFKK